MSDDWMDSDDEFMESEEEFMANLREEFIETVEKNVPKLYQLYDDNDVSEIAKISHDIKGTAGLFEWNEGSEIALELNDAAKLGEMKKVRILIDKLNQYFVDQGIL